MRKTALEEAHETTSFVLLALALFALYLVTHPYRGLYSDALIYVTRAFAPPALVQGDMLFSNERQTALTLFGGIFRLFNAVLPVARAAMALTLCGVAVWFAGLLVLARALARAASLPPQTALAMVALVALAPLGYSAGSSFTAGEVLAVPRPFAEGAVLAAFAMVLERRWAAAVFALLVAAAFHPLMAAAGAAVAFTWAALEDRRLWLVALAGVLAALVAAALGAHYVSNLLATFDADWLALLRVRTSYLFVSQAPASFWADLLLRATILFAAARLCAGAVRRLLVAALVASAIALIVSLVFSDLWPSMLVTQLQPWRVLFVPAILAPMAVVLLAAKGEGLHGRITLALVACAFMTRDVPVYTIPFSLCVLAFQFGPVAARTASARVEALLWIIAAAAWIALDALNLVTLGKILAEAPGDFSLQWSYLWVLRPLALPLSALVVFMALRLRLPRAPLALGMLAVATLVAVLRFDDRAPVDVSLETRQAPDLVKALPEGSSPVLWLSLGKEPWYWLGRPNWVAPLQASSIVFSRDLAVSWLERTRFLVDQGIYAREILANQAAPTPRQISGEAVAAVCGRPDGPAAIIAPLRAGEAAPGDARRVLAPAPSFFMQSGGVVRFDKVDSYAVWTCARETKP